MNTILDFHVLCWLGSKVSERDELLNVDQESNVKGAKCWLATPGTGSPELLACGDHQL